MFCVVCRKHQEKLKTMSGFTKAFMQGRDNFKTSALSDHDKSKINVEAVNEGKYIEKKKRGEQYCPALESLSVPKNAIILKWFNRIQATEKAELINCLKWR